jgi:DNA replication protein DnaC
MKKLETKSTVLLKHHLKALKLPTMTAECEKVAARCARENVDHLGFQLQLCELELLERERRAAQRRLKAARLPSPKVLDSFDFAAAPAVNKPQILELARCEYIDRRENVLLIGASGSGKTHLATALAMEACGRGKRVRFHRVTELATLLLEAREERQLTRMRSQLAKLDLLILDELGYVPASKVGAELLFDVISTAYERTSVIVTTNLPFEEWKEVLGSERLTGATLDRLTHRCTIIETGRESYRLREARRRRRGAEGRSPAPAPIDDDVIER